MLWQRETLIYGFCTRSGCPLHLRKQCLPKKSLRIVGVPRLSPPLSSPKDSSKRATDFVDQTSKALFYLRKKSLPRWVTDLGRTFQSKSLYIVLTVFLIHIQGRENIKLSIVYISNQEKNYKAGTLTVLNLHSFGFSFMEVEVNLCTWTRWFAPTLSNSCDFLNFLRKLIFYLIYHPCLVSLELALWALLHL